MMLSRILAPAALIAAALASPAGAAEIIFSEGNGTITPGETLVNDFNPGGTATIAPVGSQFLLQSGTNSNGAAPAYGDGTRYLSILANGSAAFTFASAVSSVGFDLGSADAYNFVTVFFTGGGSQLFDGNTIINSGTANGDQSAARTNGRVTILAGIGQTISGIRLGSSGRSLEADNLAVVSAVPEPATWAFALVGFAAVGYSLRRRSAFRPTQLV